MTKVYLSLGSNIGDRQSYLRSAVDRLQKLASSDFRVSSYYETPAWGLKEQADFLNLAVSFETNLSAQELLIACQSIEQGLDRVRKIHWGPRTIDIDILLYGNKVIDESNLQVPHPYMRERAFVLVPLLEIADDRIRQIYQEDLDKLDRTDIVKKD